MIVFVGDLHGRFSSLKYSLRNVPRDATIIQVGDFGFWPDRANVWKATWEELELENPVLFIDGNHEYHPPLEEMKVPTEVWPGAMYVPRGTILELDTYKIGFLGGAASIDVNYRIEGHSYFSREVISESEIEPLMTESSRGLDVLVTHTAPTEIVNFHLGRLTPEFLRDWKLPMNWRDPSTDLIQRVWEYHHRQPKIVCGHFHRSLRTSNVTVLDIEEVIEFPKLSGRAI